MTLCSYNPKTRNEQATMSVHYGFSLTVYIYSVVVAGLQSLINNVFAAQQIQIVPFPNPNLLFLSTLKP